MGDAQNYDAKEKDIDSFEQYEYFCRNMFLDAAEMAKALEHGFVGSGAAIEYLALPDEIKQSDFIHLFISNFYIHVLR